MFGLVSHKRETLPSLYDDAFANYITNIIACMGFTILVWDHVITLPDEIEHIWRGRKSILVYLFLLNRYFIPLSFIGNLIAYFSDWSPEHCDRFVRYEGAFTIIAIEVTALMMLQRVRALYSGPGDRKIVALVVSVLLVETAVNAWLMTHAQAVVHNPEIRACTMIFNPDLHFWPSLSAWLPLIYDTIVIVLTLHRCLGPVKMRTASHIVRTLLKDGLLYYSVIFAVTFILAIMIVSAPDGIKNITAQLEQLLTVAMMSRITLSLRREAKSDSAILSQLHPTPMHASDGTSTYGEAVRSWRVGKRRETFNTGTRGSVASSCGGGYDGSGNGANDRIFGRGHSDQTTGFPALSEEDTRPHPTVTFSRPHDTSPLTHDNSFLSFSSHSHDADRESPARSSNVDAVGTYNDLHEVRPFHSRDNATEHRTRLSEQEVYELRTLRADPL